MTQRPAQKQTTQPGHETEMTPQPQSFMKDYKAAGKLKDKIAFISGGDSGIGRAVCIAYAKEGADIAFSYLEETEDAKITREHVEAERRRCLTFEGDITDPDFCHACIEKTAEELGGLDVLVNNAAEQHVAQDLRDIKREQLQRTFETNIFAPFYLTQAALNHIESPGCIINTTSVVAYRGKDVLMDYAATKGAMVAFTRSLSDNLVKKGIRVNAVAPGPVWTPLIPASFSEEAVSHFGESAPMERAGEPDEIAPRFCFPRSW